MYQPDIGRFFIQDRMTEISRTTPYAYAANNPINNSDLNGDFEFPAEFRRKYPNVTAYLERVLPQLGSNSVILNSISELTTRSKADITKDFQNTTDLSTPALEGRDFIWPQWGEFTPPHMILKLEGPDLLDVFENALANNDPQYDHFRNVYAVQTVITVIHEYVHYAYYKMKRKPYVRKEAGSDWEKKAFNVYVDYPTKAMAQQSNSDWNDPTAGRRYNPNIHQNSAEYFLELYPDGGGISLPVAKPNHKPKKHKFAPGKGEY